MQLHPSGDSLSKQGEETLSKLNALDPRMDQAHLTLYFEYSSG